MTSEATCPGTDLATFSTKLEDGLYKSGKGRGTIWIFIQGGILHLPTKVLHPISVITSGKPITVVGKRYFMRAADIIEEEPKFRDDIRTVAQRHGVTI